LSPTGATFNYQVSAGTFADPTTIASSSGTAVTYNVAYLGQYTTDRNTQVKTLTGGALYNWEDVLIHEMGHPMGFTASVQAIVQATGGTLTGFSNTINTYTGLLNDGTKIAAANQQFTNPGNPDYFNASGNSVTFRGTTAMRVFGDDWVDGVVGNQEVGVPIYSATLRAGSALVHVNERVALEYWAQQTDGRPFYSEAELAIFNDAGALPNAINIRDLFGHSIYQTHAGIITNSDGFNSTATYGVGLHVVAGGNTIIQSADLTANGYAGTGIRIEGDGNTVTVAQGRTVRANGDQGVGVFTTNGGETSLVNRGTIEATGTNGRGVWFNSISSKLDNTGTINAPGNNAIYVSSGSSEINFMAGSQVTGDITTTSGLLTFGKAADANGRSTNTADGTFIMNYSGSIHGDGNTDLETDGGTTILSGQHELRLGMLKNNGTLALVGAGQTSFSSALNLDSGATLSGASDGRRVTAANITNSGTIQNLSRIETSGTLDNNPDGVLRNDALIHANWGLTNRGRIEAGGAGIGTTGVEGTLANAGGTIALDVNSNHPKYAPVAGTNNDLVTVSETFAGAGNGTATVDGGVVEVKNLDNGFYRGGTRYTFLHANDGLTVTQDMIAVENGPGIALFKPVVGHDANNYWFALQRDYIYGPQGQTFNQRAVGTYLDDIGNTPNPSGDLFPVLQALDHLNTQPDVVSPAAIHALDEMSGAVYGSIATIGIQNTTVVGDTLGNQLRQPFHCCDLMQDKKWDAWAQGYGAGGSVGSDGNAQGFGYGFGGTIIGMDRLIDCHHRLGGFFSYGEASLWGNGLAEHANSQNSFGGLYYKGEDDYGYSLAYGGLGDNHYDVKRDITFAGRSAKGSFDGYEAMVYAERGLDIELGRARLQPFVGIQYIGLHQDSFAESGAGVLDLGVDAFNANSLRSALGGRLGWDIFPRERGIITFDLHGEWMHEFLEDTYSPPTAQFSNPGLANFESSSKFTIHGVDLGRNYAVFGTGLNWNFHTLRLFGGYDVQLSDLHVLHSGNVGTAVCW